MLGFCSLDLAVFVPPIWTTGNSSTAHRQPQLARLSPGHTLNQKRGWFDGDVEIELNSNASTGPRRSSIPDRATGHTSASVGRKYGNGVPLDVLAEAVAKVSYRGLDLSHLHHGL